MGKRLNNGLYVKANRYVRVSMALQAGLSYETRRAKNC